MADEQKIFICPYCGQLTKVIWVHGHGQCAICKTIIDECCRGEQSVQNTSEKKETQSQNTKQNEKEFDPEH
ncbi:MAG: hypothetical protein R2794_07150 [Chitinophagales bacterium]